MGQHEWVQFLCATAVLLGLARILGFAARRLGQTQVLGEILAGILIGPSLFGRVFPDWEIWLFPKTGSVATGREVLTFLGFVFFMGYSGTEIDVRQVLKKMKAVVSISLSSLIFPFLVGVRPHSDLTAETRQSLRCSLESHSRFPRCRSSPVL